MPKKANICGEIKGNIFVSSEIRGMKEMCMLRGKKITQNIYLSPCMVVSYTHYLKVFSFCRKHKFIWKNSAFKNNKMIQSKSKSRKKSQDISVWWKVSKRVGNLHILIKIGQKTVWLPVCFSGILCRLKNRKKYIFIYKDKIINKLSRAIAFPKRRVKRESFKLSLCNDGNNTITLQSRVKGPTCISWSWCFVSAQIVMGPAFSRATWINSWNSVMAVEDLSLYFRRLLWVVFTPIPQ